ncbi:hypothetical protein Nepgr_014247 [Nepenthes gracilis]|uniref:Legumain prodomain domain-containing protein n=1 Tax=Nepenthes gracilis TaxID=150966 RepID=A0AAD3XQ41_NEPGR|nr:hypothetical protein Nepgr_014247 [Nepenthes gracilis]
MAAQVTTMITTIALIALSSVIVESRITTEEFKTTFKPSTSNGKVEGTRWAVLVAGSYGYWNYRHQANVCHAYQLLRRGGLKDENIIVFMFDDIAFNEENPRPGVIINRPDGSDVYNGVPKDYTGEDASVDNLFAVILGNKTALKGGSGKVLNSGPNDHIFIYYGDHGGPGILMMPTDEELYAHDLINVLKKKHSSGTYKSMVIYVEACESGSMFDGLLPKGLNIYATTAANPNESSYGYYCPGMYPPPPEVYNTCLGDLYSISWLEDSDLSNLRDETLRKQYEVVKRRTGYSSSSSSHVMQYGDINISKDKLFIYMGANPDNENSTSLGYRSTSPTTHPQAVNQRDASILYLNEKLRAAPEGTEKWVKAWNDFSKEMAHRSHVDRSVQAIGELVIGAKNAAEVMRAVRPQGQPLVDDWDCLKTLVDIYKHHCGSLSRYGIKHMRAFANMCNAGVGKDQMAWAAAKACT